MPGNAIKKNLTAAFKKNLNAQRMTCNLHFAAIPQSSINPKKIKMLEKMLGVLDDED